MNGGYMGLDPALGSGCPGAGTQGGLLHSPSVGKHDWEEVGDLVQEPLPHQAFPDPKTNLEGEVQ